jgi:hypothetical protein
MAGKGTLSNSLLGKYIGRVFGTDHLWRNFGPVAEIVAAYVDSGKVQVSAVDKRGSTHEFCLEHVKLFPSHGDAFIASEHYDRLFKMRAELFSEMCKLAPGSPELKAKAEEVSNIERFLMEL